MWTRWLKQLVQDGSFLKANPQSLHEHGKRSKDLVFKGKFERTKSGLKKENLTRSKSGKIVSARKHAQGKSAYHRIQSWVHAMLKARTELGLVGFVAVKKGSPLYTKTMEIYGSRA